MSDSTHSGEWAGDNPYFLVIREYHTLHIPDEPPRKEARSTVVDLDTGWTREHAELLRVPAAWMLCSKQLSVEKGHLVPVLITQVEEGEQPFYARRHIGLLGMGSGDSIESTSHGIGVKQRDGSVDGLFILPNGSITTDDDVYWVGDKMNKGQL